MSSTCILTTAAVPPELLPDAVPSYYQALELINSGHENGQFLSGRSRNDWLPWAVNRYSAAFGIQGLEFFGCEPWKSEHNCSTFLFKGSEIDRISEAIAVMLARAEAQPDAFADVLDAGYEGGHVLAALERAEPSLMPTGDDGTGLKFLFAYLKSLQWFCRQALAKGQAIVHAQWC